MSRKIHSSKLNVLVSKLASDFENGDKLLGTGLPTAGPRIG